MDARYASLVDTAEAQHGVFRLEQAETCGFSKAAVFHRVKRGSWRKIYAGVYKVGGAPPTYRQLLHAALLRWAPESAASHRTAGWIWGLVDQPAVVEINTVAAARRADGVITHRRILPAHDLTIRNGFSVTSVPRTLLDLTASIPREADAALDRALRQRLTNVDELAAFLRRTARQGVPGIRLLRLWVIERGMDSGLLESPLERRFLRLLGNSNLMPPAVQYKIYDGDRICARADFAYPEHKVAIEVDGLAFHSNPTDMLHDLRKRNLLARLGWTVIHVTKADLDSAKMELLRTIEATLARSHLHGVPANGEQRR